MSNANETANSVDAYSSFRIFLSYAHEDTEFVEILAKALEDMGHEPLWDRSIHPGTPFTEAIKTLIERSHLFIPVITEHSQKRPWVHQETGYAIALNIPVLPLAIGELPSEMTAALQAISIAEDCSNLVSSLRGINFERLILPKPRRPVGNFKVAEWSEMRADTLACFGNWVLDLGEYGHVRYRSALSSFSIPDYDLDTRFWQCRDGNNLRSDYYHHLQREERRVLTRHAMEKGCSLIIDPYTSIFDNRGPRSRAVRLQILLEFIENFFTTGKEDKLHIVFSPTASKGDLVIVGNFFFAESTAARSGGYYQTIFNSHPPTVLERLRRFDQEFDNLHDTCGVTPADAKLEIRKILDELPPNRQCIDVAGCKTYCPSCFSTLQTLTSDVSSN